LILFALLFMATASQPAAHIGYAVQRVNGVWVHVVTVDLASPKVKVSGVVADPLGRAQPVSQMLSRSKPTVALTGTFHGTHSHLPVGDIVIDGAVVYRGYMPSCLGIDWYNRARIVTPERGRTQDWRGYEYVLGAGIRVVRDGAVSAEPWCNKDGNVFRPNPRTAVGVTAGNKLLLVATQQSVTLSGLGGVLKALGARDAICLDGGSSVCLYYRGKMVIPTKRKLTNMLVVYEDSNEYQRVKDVLVPRVKKRAR
jgi:hypothetical protein